MDTVFHCCYGPSLLLWSGPSCSAAGGCSSNGLSEDQLASSLATLQSLAVASEGDMKVLRRRGAEVGTTAECLVRRIVGEDDFLEVRSVGVDWWEWVFVVGVEQ